ncbi:MAG TPA: alpha/beta fold hydrolase [Burkholderiaceae bacterium]|nr:alpha/beta fold hydrolase [Burkholderiaceae bacterium]
MKRTMTTLTVTAALLLPLLLLAVWLGGPRPVARMDSIHLPFAQADFSGLPAPSHFAARDGTTLAFLRYPAMGTVLNRRLVLVHGSSSRARSMHVLARALAQAGFEVVSLDMRGHGDSGARGHIAYVGQLEDDVADFMQAQPFAGPSSLVGFSSGGGFTLRLAASAQGRLFDRYLLLSPFLHHQSPVTRPDAGGWVSVGMPRLVALNVLNALGISHLNHLPVLRFALDAGIQSELTPSYSHTLAENFRPHMDWRADLVAAQGQVQVLAGTHDEIFIADRYAETLTQAGRALPVTLVNGVDHMGMTLDPRGIAAVVKAAH